MNTTASVDFSRLVQSFFSEHLVQQKNVSPKTVLAYRDTFRLLFVFLNTRHRKSPTQLNLTDLNASNLLGFLDYLEKVRHNTVRTRNARWAALRTFLHYAIACHGPEGLAEAHAALAIPLKRWPRKILGFLSRDEMQAILEAPNQNTWSGQRDRLLFLLLYNTGARISEILQIRVEHLRDDRSVQLLGKGRKERVIPIWKNTYGLLRQWIRHENRQVGQLILTNRLGQPLTRSGSAHRLSSAVQVAARNCPSLQSKHISLHSIRHTCAMHLLQAGIAPEVIALWLGHESPTTTHLYVEADLAMKEQALQKIRSPKSQRFHFQPTDALLRFLDGL